MILTETQTVRVIAVRCEDNSVVRIIRNDIQPVIAIRVSEQGPAGAGDAFYTHDQMIPSATWTVNHNLNKYPSITVVDSSGSVVEGDINYVSANQIVVTFTSAFAGTAYCN